MLTTPRGFIFLLLFVLAAAMRADVSLDHARYAQARLGPETWSRVIRIENSASVSRYPRQLHALVFEFAGRLWFYTASEGTQSFSLHAGRLAEEKADFAALLADIEPGFVRWTVLPPRPDAPPPRGGLANGCFVESVAELRARLARGEEMERPRLLSFFEDTSQGRRGHTVLVYGRGAVLEFFDLARPLARPVLEKSLGHDPLALARALEGPAIVKARYVTFDLSAPVPDAVVAAARARNGERDTDPDPS